MENVTIRWEMPRRNYVKINVSGFFREQPFQNGNQSGIGVVIRDSRGSILRMYAGSLRINDRRINELYSFLEGMKRAYYAKFPNFILESDHADAYWEWRHSAIDGAIVEHAHIVQQLNQRKGDQNFKTEIRLSDPLDNALAAYLAEYGGEHWTSIVRIKKPFGRVHELWNLDMGLGSVNPQFLVVREEDLIPEVVEAEFDPPVVAEVEAGVVNEGQLGLIVENEVGMEDLAEVMVDLAN